MVVCIACIAGYSIDITIQKNFITVINAYVTELQFIYNACLTQLVEYLVANEDVAGSSPVARTKDYMKSKTYIRLSHKREDMKDFKWVNRYPWAFRMYKYRLARRLKI